MPSSKGTQRARRAPTDAAASIFQSNLLNLCFQYLVPMPLYRKQRFKILICKNIRLIFINVVGFFYTVSPMNLHTILAANQLPVVAVCYSIFLLQLPVRKSALSNELGVLYSSSWGYVASLSVYYAQHYRWTRWHPHALWSAITKQIAAL